MGAQRGPPLQGVKSEKAPSGTFGTAIPGRFPERTEPPVSREITAPGSEPPPDPALTDHPNYQETPTLRSDKSAKRAFVTFGTSPPRRFLQETEQPAPREIGTPQGQTPQEKPPSCSAKSDKRVQKDSKVTSDKGAESESGRPTNVVLLAVPPGVPEAWVQGVADLLAMSCPASCPPERWNVLCEDSYCVLRDHAARAHELGWVEYDLFGVHPERPWARFDCMGLVPLLNGAAVVALSDTEGTIEKPSGARVTFRRRGQVPDEACLLWELL